MEDGCITILAPYSICNNVFDDSNHRYASIQWIPGEGDITLSWSLNWDFVGLYRDLGFSVLVLIFTGIFLGKRSRYLMVFTLLVLFSSFNDWV